MRLKRIRLGLVVFCGWLVILASAALILPRTESRVIGFPIVALMILWFVLSVIALALYFYRKWRRAFSVPCDWVYIVWMSVETLFALVVLAGIVLLFALPS